MTTRSTVRRLRMSKEHHVALHLAHRWFAFLEAPGGDLTTHLAMFHPAVQLSGHRKSHLFASDHASLIAWFAAVPDAISSHHVIHSTFSTADSGDGLLSMVVAYQSPTDAGARGSIISYQTRIEFAPEGPRFIALDKTPILPDTRESYEPSWSINRTLALLHGELAGLGVSDDRLRSLLGDCIYGIEAYTDAGEGSRDYEAHVIVAGDTADSPRNFTLTLLDDLQSVVPRVGRIAVLREASMAGD